MSVQDFLDQSPLDGSVITPNARAFYKHQNNKRTRTVHIRLTGTLTVAANAGNVVRNQGSLLGAIATIGLVQGSTDQVVVDARALRHLSEYNANGPLPATRVTTAQVVAGGAFNLVEDVFIALATPWAARPFELYFKEQNPGVALRTFIQQGPAGVQGITNDVAGTGTLTNVAATVVQIYDERVAALPWFVAYIDQVSINVPGANNQLRLDLPVSDYMHAILVQQDTNLGEVTDIITSLSYRGDSFNIVGNNYVPWDTLIDQMVRESGGAAAAISTGIRSWWLWNHIRSGQITGMLPPNQVANLRLEFNAQPSATGTSSLIRVTRVMYRRDLKVCRAALPEAVAAGLAA